jgi:hypothetical protein
MADPVVDTVRSMSTLRADPCIHLLFGLEPAVGKELGFFAGEQRTRMECLNLGRFYPLAPFNRNPDCSSLAYKLGACIPINHLGSWVRGCVVLLPLNCRRCMSRVPRDLQPDRACSSRLDFLRSTLAVVR